MSHQIPGSYDLIKSDGLVSFVKVRRVVWVSVCRLSRATFKGKGLQNVDRTNKRHQRTKLKILS